MMKKGFPVDYSFIAMRTSLFLSLALMLLSSFYPSILLYQSLAVSHAFDESLNSDKEIIGQIDDLIQTYGNEITHLGSDYANILAVNCVSDGKTLHTTF